MKNLPGDMASN